MIGWVRAASASGTPFAAAIRLVCPLATTEGACEEEGRGRRAL